MDDKEIVMGVELGQIHHIYLQGTKDPNVPKNEDGLTKMYVVYNGPNNELFCTVQDISTWSRTDLNRVFTQAKVSEVAGRDYNVYLEGNSKFDELDEMIAKQEKGSYDFNAETEQEPAYSFVTEDINAEEETVANTVSEPADTNIEEEYAAEVNPINTVIESKIPEDLGKVSVRAASEDTFKEKEYVINDETKKNSKEMAIRVVIATVAVALGVGAYAATNKSGQADDVVLAEDPAITTEITPEIEPETVAVEEAETKYSLEGKTFRDYVENAKDSVQKQKMLKYAAMTLILNRSEDWMYSVIDDEKKEDFSKEGYTVIEDEAIFGWLPKELFYTDIVSGTHTNEEIASMMNAEQIDIDSVINSSNSIVNNAIQKNIYYRLNSDKLVINYTVTEEDVKNGDALSYICDNYYLNRLKEIEGEDLNITADELDLRLSKTGLMLINNLDENSELKAGQVIRVPNIPEDAIDYTEEEKAEIYMYVTMLQDYKDLKNSGKAKEAEAKMNEMKEKIVAYGFSADTKANKAKHDILATDLPTWSIIARSYGYKGEATYHLYNGKEDKYWEKVVKDVDLFEQVTVMDPLVLGYYECKNDEGSVLREAFNQDELLKQMNVNSNDNVLVIHDDGVSKVDQYASGRVENLRNYNNYAAELVEANAVADAAYLGSGGNTENTAYLQSNSELDKVTEGTYKSDDVLELIDTKLKEENKYPKFIQFFSSKFSKFGKEIREFLEKGGKAVAKATTDVTKIIKQIAGRTYYVPGTTWTETITETHTDTYVSERTEHRKNEHFEEELEKEKKKSDKKASKDKETIDKAFNDIMDGKDVKKTGDKDIDKYIDNVKKDKKENDKQLKDAADGAKKTYKDKDGNTHNIHGGDVTIDSKYKDADVQKEHKDPVSSVDKTTPIHKEQPVSNEEVIDQIEKKKNDPSTTTVTDKKINEAGDTVTHTTSITKDGDVIKETKTESADGKKQETKTESTEILDGEEVEVTITETHEDTGKYTEEKVEEHKEEAPKQKESKPAEEHKEEAPKQEESKPAEEHKEEAPKQEAPTEEKSSKQEEAPKQETPKQEESKPAEESAPVVEEQKSYFAPVVEDVTPEEISGSGEIEIDPEFASFFEGATSEDEIDAIIEQLENAAKEEESKGKSK